ncbi:MAG: hypothetical protein IIX23_03020 [Oscillospiraceae bacterium]|nr:hypothetical protein [Oscillospiraceae bacterium]
MENEHPFILTYSSQQQKEVEAIRKKYLPKEEDKMEQLRKLHSVPSTRAQTAALTIGIIGALIMGLGMSLIMTQLGAALGILATVLGVILGIAGMICVALAYPIYNRVLRKQRQRIAPQILQLSDELLQ